MTFDGASPPHSRPKLAGPRARRSPTHLFPWPFPYQRRKPSLPSAGEYCSSAATAWCVTGIAHATGDFGTKCARFLHPVQVSPVVFSSGSCINTGNSCAERCIEDRSTQAESPESHKQREIRCR
ncbi:hypothetical protein LTR28_013022, partial [Elasticomyces elasticus]